MFEKQDLERQLYESSAHRNQLITNMYDSRKIYDHNVSQKDSAIQAIKDIVVMVDGQKHGLQDEVEKLKEALTASEVQVKRLDAENKSLKKRIERMKNNSFRDIAALKICKNCHKEYNDKANYNWSCRTHQSEYGGVMWWCCGKKGKDEPGCKFAQHQHKDDNDMDLDIKKEDGRKTD